MNLSDVQRLALTNMKKRGSLWLSSAVSVPQRGGWQAFSDDDGVNKPELDILAERGLVKCHTDMLPIGDYAIWTYTITDRGLAALAAEEADHA